MNKNMYFKWERNNPEIEIDHIISNREKPIRGIYGIFVGLTKKERKCVYVGRSVDIYHKIYNSSNGHVKRIKHGTHFIEMIKDLNENEYIYIEVLEEVAYVFDNYNKDLQCLASSENKFIDQFQSAAEYLYQVPEGTKVTLNDWKELKRTIKGDR